MNIDLARAALAPTGVLRAGINIGNFLLVSGGVVDGVPVGVSPDLAGMIAERLGVPLLLLPFASPGALADDAGKNIWDIANIGAEPARAQTIDFTPAYVEIESTYLVPAGSTLQTIADVDQPGIRIASTARAAYDLWLEANIKHATLHRAVGLDGAFDLFVNDKLDALAGLKPRLLTDVTRLPGARILAGQFAAVQQAVGVAKGNPGAAFLIDFVAEAKAAGVIAALIARHKVVGLSVAP